MALERKTCDRCGGSGSYSWNQKDGSRCYGCGGSGEKLTARGQAAMDFLVRSMETSLDDLKIGDKVRPFDSAPIVTVDKIELNVDYHGMGNGHKISGVTAGGSRYDFGGPAVLLNPRTDKMVVQEYRFRRYLVSGEKAELISAAETYQATLNCKGEPE